MGINQNSKGEGVAQGGSRKKSPPSSKKFPKAVTVNGVKWKIRRADIVTDDPLCGMLDADVLTVWVCSRLSEKEQASTLLHELIHASDYKLSEKTVSKLEEGLFPILWEYGWRPSKGKTGGK